jgi:hypothetical protein
LQQKHEQSCRAEMTEKNCPNSLRNALIVLRINATCVINQSGSQPNPDRRTTMAKRLEKKTFTSTITLRNGTRIEIEERLTVDVIEAEARKVNAVKVQLENGTEIFLN